MSFLIPRLNIKYSKMKCFQCENDHTDENAVQCDGCKRNICLQCSNLTSSEARVMGLKGKRTLLYLCPPCREALFQVPKLIKSYDGLREELNDIKKQLSESQTAPPPVPLLPTVSLPDTNALIEELAERERRSNNVIMVGIKESESDNNSDRIAYDELCVKKILSEINTESDHSVSVVRVLRLGRREPGGGKPRPVKVVFGSRQDSLWVLKNKSKLKKEVRVYDDKTPKQREELNKLRENLKVRIDKGEKDLTIKYIRGSPKIVHQKN